MPRERPLGGTGVPFPPATPADASDRPRLMFVSVSTAAPAALGYTIGYRSTRDTPSGSRDAQVRGGGPPGDRTQNPRIKSPGLLVPLPISLGVMICFIRVLKTG